MNNNCPHNSRTHWFPFMTCAAVQLRVCLPQLMSEVAIRVNLRGRGQYCPTTGRVDSPFMAFVRNQVSALDLNPSCSLLDLAVVSCTAVGKGESRDSC